MSLIFLPAFLHPQPSFHFLFCALSSFSFHCHLLFLSFPCPPLLAAQGFCYPSIYHILGFELPRVMPGGFLWLALLFTLIRAPQMSQHGMPWKHCQLDWLTARKGFQVEVFMCVDVCDRTLSFHMHCENVNVWVKIKKQTQYGTSVYFLPPSTPLISYFSL